MPFNFMQAMGGVYDFQQQQAQRDLERQKAEQAMQYQQMLMQQAQFNQEQARAAAASRLNTATAYQQSMLPPMPGQASVPRTVPNTLPVQNTLQPYEGIPSQTQSVSLPSPPERSQPSERPQQQALQVSQEPPLTYEDQIAAKGRGLTPIEFTDYMIAHQPDIERHYKQLKETRDETRAADTSQREQAVLAEKWTGASLKKYKETKNLDDLIPRDKPTTPTSFMIEAAEKWGKGTPEYKKDIGKHLNRLDAPQRETGGTTFVDEVGRYGPKGGLVSVNPNTNVATPIQGTEGLTKAGSTKKTLTAMDKAVANTVNNTMNEAGLSIRNLSELTNMGKIHLTSGTYDNLSSSGLFGATTKQVAQRLTNADKEMYRSILLPLARQAATMQNPRYRINEESVNQAMDTVISSPGQKHITMLEKMAEAKQNILMGAKSSIEAGNLNEDQKDAVMQNIESIKRDIPWDVDDVIKFHRTGKKVENFGDWLNKKQNTPQGSTAETAIPVTSDEDMKKVKKDQYYSYKGIPHLKEVE